MRRRRRCWKYHLALEEEEEGLHLIITYRSCLSPSILCWIQVTTAALEVDRWGTPLLALPVRLASGRTKCASIVSAPIGTGRLQHQAEEGARTPPTLLPLGDTTSRPPGSASSAVATTAPTTVWGTTAASTTAIRQGTTSNRPHSHPLLHPPQRRKCFLPVTLFSYQTLVFEMQGLMTRVYIILSNVYGRQLLDRTVLNGRMARRCLNGLLYLLKGNNSIGQSIIPPFEFLYVATILILVLTLAKIFVYEVCFLRKFAVKSSHNWIF